MRKKPLARYHLENLTRKELLARAWDGTHADYKSVIDGREMVMWNGGLAPLESLPDDELLSRYLHDVQRTMQRRARAQDLKLFEVNPDDPSASILWADAEILFRTASGWVLGYVQPANFDQVELNKAAMYAQVVAAMHRRDSADDVVAVLRSPLTYTTWKKLEQQGRVIRNEDGEVVDVTGEK
jgi:hypothetical protein